MQVKELKSGYRLVQLSKLSQASKSPIPNTWEVKKLKDIVEINPGVIDVDYSNDKILYIDIGSIECFEIQEYEHFDLNKRPSRAQRIVKKNDIIVSTVRPYLKAFTKISNSKPNLICSTGFAVLRPRNSDDADFIFNYIKSPIFEVNIIRHMEGMAYPAVTSKMVADSLIPYPTNKNERFKIGSIFLNLNDLIQKTDQVIEQTQKLKKGLMQRLLTKGIGHTKFKNTSIGKTPEEWTVKMLSDISELIMGQSPPGDSYNVNNIGSPLLNGPTEFGTEHPTPIQFTTKPTRLSQKDDILLCVRGSTTGRLNLSDREYCIGRGLASVRGLKGITDTKWLYYQFLRIQDKIYNIASGGGSTFPNINSDLIRKILLPFPKFEEQQKISSIISNVQLKIQKHRNQKLKLEDLKKGLMQKLLTGKIRVKV